MNVISNLSLLRWFPDSRGNADPTVDLRAQVVTKRSAALEKGAPSHKDFSCSSGCPQR